MCLPPTPAALPGLLLRHARLATEHPQGTPKSRIVRVRSLLRADYLRDAVELELLAPLDLGVQLRERRTVGSQ